MNNIESLTQEINTCLKCPLGETRTHAVVGDGNIHSSIMLIGEGPGFYEDQQGIPFVGRSGQLLNKILQACGFTREKDVFITNIVKCRPPKNRDPTPQERQTCLPYLYAQIEYMQPKIIVLLGATALKGLVDSNARITKMRGQWLDWQGHLVMPTYHPSALLRNPQLKRPVWDDFKQIVYKYRELVDPNHFSKYC